MLAKLPIKQIENQVAIVQLGMKASKTSWQ